MGGFFRSLQFTSLNTLAYAEIDAAADEPRDDLVERRAAALALVRRRARARSCCTRPCSTTRREELGPDDFAPAYFAIAAISLLALLFFLPLPRDAGAEISGRREVAPAALPAE